METGKKFSCWVSYSTYVAKFNAGLASESTWLANRFFKTKARDILALCANTLTPSYLAPSNLSPNNLLNRWVTNAV
jgi:hypothetical protein